MCPSSFFQCFVILSEEILSMVRGNPILFKPQDLCLRSSCSVYTVGFIQYPLAPLSNLLAW